MPSSSGRSVLRSSASGGEGELPLPNVERTDSVKSSSGPAPVDSALSPDASAEQPAASSSGQVEEGADALVGDAGPGSDQHESEDALDQQAAKDAGSDAWVKPEWARPDDDVKLEPLPVDPPRKDTVNPYTE